ncbi:Lipase (class 3) [Musa troglodytarum]|uniref:Lipase (Class 3) n=1 Tax=Musa troglodytarum TaxID=320322 RepID=A0A9E7HZA4_9LILI|nr:Lipase (class 3) [Musa troglodytarum]URE42777.1 Lipase (class 3) [Musa troglodytarum]URE42778.1 Lipase (class 3) [Musa troglodytarum]URE42780.1 Lipase (class 3) [Musa troglodytarum]
MASEKDVFDISGPLHITSVNWKCSHHRRSVAACLVQGAYVSELDRQHNRKGQEAFAPPWWEFFRFELTSNLVDDADSSIFGAIYEFKPASSKDSSVQDAPNFVVAFRGTIPSKESLAQDGLLDINIIQNGLHRTSRFAIAMRAVQNIVSAAKSSNVWLAGHSLGAAIATLAGKNMAKMGTLIETFLFNPPFVSAPIERIKDTNVKQGIRIASSFLTAGLSFALKDHHQERSTPDDSFAMLSSWVPRLFVNPCDFICSEYIGYFEHRNFMEKLGVGGIERLATQNSIGGLFLRALGKDSDPLHLLPSANLTTNLSPSPDFKIAHGLHQWWRPDLHLQSKQYHYG